MRVFVAGAAGAIGRQLVPMLIDAGHEVSGTTRNPERAEWLASIGARPITLDIYDAKAVQQAIRDDEPDAVIHQLTDLAHGFAPEQLRANSRLRQEGTRHIVEAMLAAGVTRLVAQSGAWLYADGPQPRTEDDPLAEATSGSSAVVLPGIRELERLTLQTVGIDGVVLRYGFLYGPATAYETAAEAAPGPTVHVNAAARAAVAGLTAPAGIYNIVDDGRSVSNARARTILGWEPSSR